VAAIDVVVARQAIFDRTGDVYGYELLFRPIQGGTDAGVGVDGDLMTSTVLFSTMTIGVERLVGNGYIFCNADRGLLTGSVPVALPPERTVLEVLETVAVDGEVIAGCQRLVALGFRLALDDFTWREGAERLLELADIVKIDLRLVPPAELPAMVARCRRYGVALVAEKIETAEEFSRCLALGFEYFQGYALERPRTVPGRAINMSNPGTWRAAASLLAGELDIGRLERILRTEPGMTYQLLQLAGIGANHGTRRKIRTVREALVLLGTRRIRSWIALLMLVQSDTTPTEEITTALARARMSELLAEELMPELAGLAFTAGMLSALDALLEMPIEDILQTLPLDDELREAAFGDATPAGRLVRDVIDHLSARTDRPRRSPVTAQDFDVAASRALAWALEAADAVSAVA
jgi:c-di-GMP-related signal transduction protein